MIVICYDCPSQGHTHPYFLEYRYPCEDCATEWVAKHKRQTGHNIVARPETYADKYVYSSL